MSTTSRSSRRHLAPRRAAVAGIFAAGLAASSAVHGQLPPSPEPPGNPLTTAKANLGKVLFWDEQISSTRTVACGTCHFPSVGGEDPRSGVDPAAVHPGPDGNFNTADDIFGSPGVPLNDDGFYGWSNHFGMLPQVTARRTGPTINAGYAPELFWEGRAANEFVDPVTQQVVLASGAALESQAVGPPVSDVEMADVGRAWADVLARVGESVPLALSPFVQQELLDWIDRRPYAELFGEAFGDPAITAPRVAMAIASYERTQVSDQTPFDDWLNGGLPLTPQEQDGFDVFNTVCNSCHDTNPPALLTDHTFRYTGVTAQSDDPGRMDVTGLPADEGKMRVPLLRNLEVRAPFMHNGRLETLEDVIDFYDQGGFFSGPNKDPLIQELNLSQQDKDDLLAFLTRPLTDSRVAAGDPPFDRPTLYTESARVPVVEDVGAGGTNGHVPVMVALEPPVLGNPSFTVGVWNALGGAMARLVIDDVDPGLVEPAPGTGDLFDGTVTLDGSVGVPADGFGSASVAIPQSPPLDGDEWFGRWYVADGGVSPVVRFTTFQGRLLGSIFADGFESGDTSRWSTTIP